MKGSKKTAEFWEKVDIQGEDECWLWKACVSDGYGALTLNGKGARAHRVALESKLGRPLAEGMCALHTCDNPLCCNPSHLYEGTRVDNGRDTATRERRKRGEEHRWAKLTDEQVAEIRRLRTEELNLSWAKLGARFGIHPKYARTICKGNGRLRR